MILDTAAFSDGISLVGVFGFDAVIGGMEFLDSGLDVKGRAAREIRPAIFDFQRDLVMLCKFPVSMGS